MTGRMLSRSFSLGGVSSKPPANNQVTHIIFLWWVFFFKKKPCSTSWQTCRQHSKETFEGSAITNKRVGGLAGAGRFWTSMLNIAPAARDRSCCYDEIWSNVCFFCSLFLLLRNNVRALTLYVQVGSPVYRECGLCIWLCLSRRASCIAGAVSPRPRGGQQPGAG